MNVNFITSCLVGLRHSLASNKKTYWFAFLLVTVVILLATDTKYIVRGMWKYWTGHEIEWRDARLVIHKDFFVFPDYDSEFVMFGRFEGSKKAFPDKNIIVISYAANHHNKLFSRLKKVCEAHKKCANYKEYSLPRPFEQNKCIEFNALFDSSEDRIFHVYCDTGKVGTTIEFHGENNTFELFKQQFNLLIESTSKTKEYGVFLKEK